ncbi:M20 metallopeptidase family protein [Streptomyces iconiensis]|uniref:M20 family metallopeptidase n=1 Tax=Streptomyces iconiensis TaxID=1384038 RepID=A0ABT6ZXM4_9ACTN|nr:M20 family metallopeptidase [Streptomyces iconiensis]MDJ1133602.1 M20 family metallopeptidase [Streptomyces iconiensis]
MTQLTTSLPRHARLRQDAEALAAELSALRHALHAEPELGLELPLTQAKVLRALDGLPLEITTGDSLGSVTAVLRGARPGPAVLLRGDMDALPLREEADVPYVSRTDGVMHACGHDLHVAGLVGAAKLLCARRGELAGSVVFMFQPGEEGYDGAGAMIAEGVLGAAGADAPLVGAYALHVSSNGNGVDPLGGVHTRVGTQTVANGELHVTVRGKGGHGSTPHQAADPVPAMAEMITALQTLVTRTVPAFEPLVLTVGHVSAGTKPNIIPEDAYFGATVRCTSTEGLRDYLRRATALCEGVAAAHGVRADVRAEEQYPAMVHAEEAVALTREVVTDMYGPGSFRLSRDPLMVSEDFSRVLEAVPGVQFQLSACPPDVPPEEAPFNHSGLAVFDDGALPVGAAVLAEMALRRLESAEG